MVEIDITLRKTLKLCCRIDSDLVSYPPDLPSKVRRFVVAIYSSQVGAVDTIEPVWNDCSSCAFGSLESLGETYILPVAEEPGPLGTDQFYDTTAFVLEVGSSTFSIQFILLSRAPCILRTPHPILREEMLTGSHELLLMLCEHNL